MLVVVLRHTTRSIYLVLQVTLQTYMKLQHNTQSNSEQQIGDYIKCHPVWGSNLQHRAVGGEVTIFEPLYHSCCHF